MLSIGGIGLGVNPENERIIIFDVSEINDFGKALKYKEGDEILEFNNSKLTVDNVQEVLSNYISTAKEGEKLNVVVARKNKKGKEKQVKLKAKQRMVSVDIYNNIEVNKNANTKQIVARNAWLGLTGN